MLKELITVLVQSTVGGPDGVKLRPGQVVSLEDSPYVRVLVQSGTVELIDPPSLDLEFLEKAGYELREGFSYAAEKESENNPLEGFLTKKPKKEISNENGVK